jgi:hypothetical protein
LLYVSKLYGASWMSFVDGTPLLRDIRFTKYLAVGTLATFILSVIGYSTLRERDTGVAMRMLIVAVSASALLPAAHLGFRPGGRLAGDLLPYLALLAGILGVGYLYLVAARPGMKVVAGLGAILLVAFQVAVDLPSIGAKRREYLDSSESHARLGELQAGQGKRAFLVFGSARTWSAHGVWDVRDASVVHTTRYYDYFRKYVAKDNCWHFLYICTNRPFDMNLNFLRFVGVQHLVVQEGSRAAVEVWSRTMSPIRMGRYLVFELDDVRPYAGLYSRTIMLDEEEIDARVARGEWREDSIFVEEARPPLNRSRRRPADGTIHETTFSNGRVRVDYSSPEESYLVIRNQYYPGWKVLVDGVRSEVFRADLLFQGVRVPPGRHEVEFIYAPLSLKIGLGLSVVGLVSLVMLFRSTQ